MKEYSTPEMQIIDVVLSDIVTNSINFMGETPVNTHIKDGDSLANSFTDPNTGGGLNQN